MAYAIRGHDRPPRTNDRKTRGPRFRSWRLYGRSKARTLGITVCPKGPSLHPLGGGVPYRCTRCVTTWNFSSMVGTAASTPWPDGLQIRRFHKRYHWRTQRCVWRCPFWNEMALPQRSERNLELRSSVVALFYAFYIRRAGIRHGCRYRVSLMS